MLDYEFLIGFHQYICPLCSVLHREKTLPPFLVSSVPSELLEEIGAGSGIPT